MQSQEETQKTLIRSLILTEKVDESLICSICQELVIDPTECESCDSIFCKDCIHQWLKKSKQCPFNCSSPLKLKGPHKLIRNALSSLKFTCANHQRGCSQQIDMKSLYLHLADCAFQLVKCSNTDCTQEVLKKEMQDHHNECGFQQIQCAKCHGTYTRSQPDQHDCISSLRIQLENANLKNSLIEQQFHTYQVTVDKKIAALTLQFHLFQKQEQIVPHTPQQLQMQTLQDHCSQKCRSGHILSWSRGIYQCCNHCKKLTFLRYFCNICVQGYCIKCRAIEVINGKCPLNHNMVFQESPLPATQCDSCQQYPASECVSNWQDSHCDFDLCNNCYKTSLNKIDNHKH